MLRVFIGHKTCQIRFDIKKKYYFIDELSDKIKNISYNNVK